MRICDLIVPRGPDAAQLLERAASLAGWCAAGRAPGRAAGRTTGRGVAEHLLAARQQGLAERRMAQVEAGRWAASRLLARLGELDSLGRHALCERLEARPALRAGRG